jgi:hypothetical protein
MFDNGVCDNNNRTPSVVVVFSTLFFSVLFSGVTSRDGEA